MKRGFWNALVPAAFALAVAAPAHALATLDATLVPGANQLSDDSNELFIDNDGTGTLTAGDYLVGVAVITSFPTVGASASTVNQVTLVFGVEILSVTPITTDSGQAASCGSATIDSCSTFEFGSGTTTLNQKLAAAGVAAVTGGDTPDSTATIYEDASNNFATTSITTAFATASDGTLRVVAGDPAGGAVTDFWAGTGPADVSEIGEVAAGTGAGSFTLNQTMLSETLAANYSPLITGRGTISPPGSGSVFPIGDDTTITITQLVPEPATLALLGVSLLGLGATTRRRRH